MGFRTKRIYEEPSPEDGTRVLVDRLWPRGVSKERSHLDRWLKAVAPSDELRVWVHEDPARWDAFPGRYAEELEAGGEATEALAWLREQGRQGTVTLLYAAKDTEQNNAVALKAYLEGSE